MQARLKVAVLYEPTDNTGSSAPQQEGRVRHKERRAPGPSLKRRGPDD